MYTGIWELIKEAGGTDISVTKTYCTSTSIHAKGNISIVIYK